jgi:DNA-binding CsgD family transcriptional regulator
VLGDTDGVAALIGEIYDAAFEPALWTGTLTRITDAVGGAQVMMGIHDFSTRSVRVIAPRMDPEHMRSYREHWGRGDLLWQRTNRAAVGEVLLAERYVPRAELIRSEFYNDWYRRLGLSAAGLGVNLYIENGVPALCGIKRSARSDHFTGEEVALFRALVPHLTRAAQIHRHLWEMELNQGLIRARIDRRGKSLIVLDAQAHIMFSSDGAEKLLAQADGLRAKAGVLSAANPDATALLERLIAGCADLRRLRERNHRGSLTIKREGRSPLRILATPFPDAQRQRGAWHLLTSPAVIVIIQDPDGERQERKTLLQQRFKLTSAEAEIALEIIKGHGRAAAAGRLGISAGTARIHLQRVFEKTGTHRQAELVRLLADL